MTNPSHKQPASGAAATAESGSTTNEPESGAPTAAQTATAPEPATHPSPGDGPSGSHGPNRFADVNGIEELIGTTIGAGSMCWENVAAAGTFDSTEASEISREAIERLSQLLGGAL